MASIGKVSGKITTSTFSFKIDGEIKKFDFVEVIHKEYGQVLCQVVEIERIKGEHLAICHIIGYRDKEDGVVKLPRSTIEPDSDVSLADDILIESIVKLDDDKSGAYVGFLDGKKIKIHLNMNKLLTKHVVVLAKSGAGKSYFVGVLLEEIIEKNIPLLVIDPHGEYSSLRDANEKDKASLERFGIKSKSYSKQLKEYGDSAIDESLVSLKLNNRMDLKGLLDIMPVKLSNNQLAILYDTVKNVANFSFSELCFALEQHDSNVKWSVIGIIDTLNNLGIFSENYTSLNELVRPGRCSVINLKGMNSTKQEILIYQLLHDLFEARKKDKVPPFFCVIEEAHNFCPERSFGETKASKIIRSIASEGRKFGLGLCVISQRPARLDKSVISQCTTQVVLKITNPNDLKTVSNSVEGITQESIDEVKNLPVGSAMICGVVDLPLFINVRTRRTRHGGESIDMLNQPKNLIEELDKFESENKLPLIYPENDSASANQKNPKKLLPAALFNCSLKGNEFKILVELISGEVVIDVDSMITARLPDLDALSVEEIRILGEAFRINEFSVTEFIKATGKSLDIEVYLKDLLLKDFLLESKRGYKVNPKVILGSLNEYSFSGNIKFEPIRLEKPKSLKKIDEIKNNLSKFTQVLDFAECYIVIR